MKRLFVNGKIFTSNEEQLYAEAMLVEDGRITWVGGAPQARVLQDSQQPMEVTDLPAVIYHPYGKGACIYSCAPMEQSKVEGTVEVFDRIILSLLEEAGGLTLRCQETEYLEQVLRYHPADEKYTLSLLNNQSVKKPVTLRDLEFTIQLDTAPKKVYTTLNTPVKWSYADGQLRLELETLEVYDVVTIEP